MELGAIGEFGLIERIQKVLGDPGPGLTLGIGDDAAILPGSGEDEIVLAADALVEGVHFDLAYGSYEDLGWKALAVNLSDLAAMAADPLAALVSFAIPDSWTVEAVEAVFTGLRDCGRRYACPVIGGDTTRTRDRAFLSVSITGKVKKGQAVLRSGARPGDLVCVTGRLGGARTGLGHLAAGGNPDEYPESTGRLARPVPLLKEAQLIKNKLGITAMIDISDGVAQDISRLCERSGTGCRLFGERLPVTDETARYCRARKLDSRRFALESGEEYELLFTLPEHRSGDLENIKPVAVTVIGEMTANAAIRTVEIDGRDEALSGLGWDHFSPETTD